MVRISSLLKITVWGISLLCAASVFPQLDSSLRLVFAGTAAAGILFDRRGKHPLPEKAVTVISLVFFLFQIFRITRTHPIEPISELLILLLGLRLLTEKNGPNCRQIFVLALLAMAASFLQNPDASRMLFLLPVLALTLAGLMLAAFQSASPGMVLDGQNFRPIAKIALGLPAASLLLMIVLFPLLPRTPYPLWNFFHPDPEGLPFVGEKVLPGPRSPQETPGRVVFRIQTEELPPENLYWRSIVLNTPEGNAWVRRPPPAGERAEVSNGRSLEQTIYAKEKAGRFLPALDVPLPGEISLAQGSSDRVFALPDNPEKSFRYRTVSRRGGELRSRDIQLDFYLRTPDGASPRVKTAAASLAERAATAGEKVDLLRRYFLGRRLTYSREGLSVQDDPVDAFLFADKRGYCEHFAASFTLMLRLMGVPARLVGGYLGGGIPKDRRILRPLDGQRPCLDGGARQGQLDSNRSHPTGAERGGGGSFDRPADVPELAHPGCGGFLLEPGSDCRWTGEADTPAADRSA